MIGRLCVKLNGREAGKTCIIVNDLDDNFVLIDGNVKRRKCNINHLEFTEKMIDIKKDASTKEVLDAMAKAGIKISSLKEDKEEVKEKPKRKRTLKTKEDNKDAKTR